MHVGYELAIIISYPTSVREIKAHKMLRILIDFTVFVKTTWFSACFEQMRIVTIFGEHGIMAHIPWWLLALELHYPVIQFLIIGDIQELEDFEGDIVLTKVQKAMITPLHQDVAAAGVWSKTQFMWPERTVPYYIPPNLGKIVLSVVLFCQSWAISYTG